MWRIDILSSFVAVSIGIFGLLTIVYSLGFMKNRPQLFQYYIYVILTIAASIGTIFTNNLLVLLVLWGFLGLTLYLLINMGDKNSSTTAKKTLIIVGGSDSLMLLGIGIVYYLTGTLDMDKIQLTVDSSQLTVIAFLCLAITAFAKAGAMPLHTWIPDVAESAPIPVSALLPASLDKLLGIYLLFRISTELFVLTTFINQFLLIIGAITILAAVMMALIQHNYKKLLGYHAVSQVGYMVMGIGTGNPVGIAGGLFHMLNNAIYKSDLFLIGGAVESKRQTLELDKLGGLSKAMPVTFFCALIASLSISGVPPFNGFVSKWMIYQGLISQLHATSYSLRVTSLLCLISAMFGSALTLASFLKLLHATFLGQKSSRSTASSQLSAKIDEVNFLMRLPMLILAIICIIFGVFASQIPLRYFILPSVKETAFLGIWTSNLATLLIIVGIVVGLVILWLGDLKKNTRQDNSYVGGEIIPQEFRPTGTEFYNTVKDLAGFKQIYQKAQEGYFDIYEQAKGIVFNFTRLLQHLHNGILPTYLVWCLLGMIVLFFIIY
ncbi:MAG: hypothetical protein FJZ16_02380 [Candidatus Omnitrophica bacterium]|nr:hypothetical protein [Candidatus Omnitrophota bacterium]